MVRLHFCEPHELIKSRSTLRQFEIFLNSQMAEPNAGPIIWAEDNNVSVYKDYLFMSKKGDENKQNLTINLHPKSAKYFDVILNGIEVFKLNSSNGNLAGPNPQPESSNSIGGKSKKKQKLLISGGGCAVGLLIDTPLGLYGVDYFWGGK
ncbi:hypothetical protein PTKIN_Ptkin12aG0020300 [Pterospermum kingtungense]